MSPASPQGPGRDAAIAELAQALFRGLEASGLAYALMRNHERFPHFGNDVDLVVAGGDLPAFGRLCALVAQEQGWDALTRCDHWGQSGEPVQDYQMFRFFRLADLAYLKIDTFHGHAVLGQPFLAETELLAGRRAEPSGRFTRIDPSQEQLWRLLQLYSEAGRGGERRERYRRLVLDHAQAEPAAFTGLIAAQLGIDGNAPIAALEAGDWAGFARLIGRGRRRFLLRAFASAPLAFAARSGRRLLGRLRSAWLRPCGFVLAVRGDAAGFARLRRVLDRLEAAGFVSLDRFVGQGGGSGRSRRRVLEYSGIVVRRSRDGETGALDLGALDEAELLRSVALRAIRRHRLLQASEAVCEG